MTDGKIIFQRVGHFEPPEYTVVLDDVVLGTVRYKIERYNLVRVYVTRQWIARDASGAVVGSRSTRRDAAALLRPAGDPDPR